MNIYPGEGSDSDDDTEDSYDEFDDGIEEEEEDDAMDQEDMENMDVGSLDGAEYYDEREVEEEDYGEEEEEYDEEEEYEEEGEEEEEDGMECEVYEGVEYYVSRALCAGSASTTSPTNRSNSYMDSSSNSAHVTPSSAANEWTEGTIKYRTVSNVGVEGSSEDHSRDEEVVPTEKEVTNETEVEKAVEKEVEVAEVAEKRTKVRTVTEDLTTPVCASRLSSSSTSTLHFVTPDSSLSRNNGIIIRGSSKDFVPDIKMFDEKMKDTKKSCVEVEVEVESTPKQNTINYKKENCVTVEDIFELSRREMQKEREISVHVIGVIQEYVINTYMTELSLACLSNLIATDLQVCIDISIAWHFW